MLNRKLVQAAAMANKISTANKNQRYCNRGRIENEKKKGFSQNYLNRMNSFKRIKKRSVCQRTVGIDSTYDK